MSGVDITVTEDDIVAKTSGDLEDKTTIWEDLKGSNKLFVGLLSSHINGFLLEPADGRTKMSNHGGRINALSLSLSLFPKQEPQPYRPHDSNCKGDDCSTQPQTFSPITQRSCRVCKCTEGQVGVLLWECYLH